MTPPLHWSQLNEKASLDTQLLLSSSDATSEEADELRPFLLSSQVWDIALERVWNRKCGNVVCGNEIAFECEKDDRKPSVEWFCGNACFLWMRSYAKRTLVSNSSNGTLIPVLQKLYPTLKKNDITQSLASHLTEVRQEQERIERELAGLSPTNKHSEGDLDEDYPQGDCVAKATPDEMRSHSPYQSEKEILVNPTTVRWNPKWSSQPTPAPIRTQIQIRGARRKEISKIFEGVNF